MPTTPNKTVATGVPVKAYFDAIKNEKRQKDVNELVKLIGNSIGMKPYMWGPSIIGYGNYHYKYESGREGDAPVAAFSSRSNGIVFYFCDIKDGEGLMARLGKYKMSKGCVYIKQLEDIDTKVLLKLIDHSINYINKKYPSGK